MEKLQDGDKIKPNEVIVKPGFGIRHLQVGMMAICAAMLYMVRSSMGVAILAMTDSANINSTHIEIYDWGEQVRGVILSSFFWGYTVMQIPAGVMGKRFGGKPLLLVALVVNGLLCLATPFLANLGGWMAVCVVRVTMGLTQACFMPCFHTILGKWAAPEERTRLSSFSYAGIQAGTIFAMPISGVLARTALGWKMIYYTMGAMTLATAALWAAFAASSPRDHRLIGDEERDYLERALQSTGKETTMPVPWRKILTCRPLYAITMAHIGCNWCFVFFLVQIPTYMKNGLDIDLASSSTLSALPFAVQWLVSMLSSILCEYIYNKNILSLTTTRKLFNSIGSFGIAIGFFVMSFLYSDQKVLAVVVLCYAVSIIGFCFSGFMLNHIDLSPNFGGLMFSLTNCLANLFGIFVPLFTGYVLGDDATDITRWRIVFFSSAALIITADITYRLFSTSELQPWNSPGDEDVYQPGKLQNGDNKTEEKKYEFSETLKKP